MPEKKYPRISARITIRLSQDQKERLDLFCERTGRDRSDVIRESVKNYLDHQSILHDKQAEKQTEK